jgi:hypothetical protein
MLYKIPNYELIELDYEQDFSKLGETIGYFQYLTRINSETEYSEFKQILQKIFREYAIWGVWKIEAYLYSNNSREMYRTEIRFYLYYSNIEYYRNSIYNKILHLIPYWNSNKLQFMKMEVEEQMVQRKL